MALITASWIAIVILSIGYWIQIWRIHIHKEVRDLSLTYHILLAAGFAILGVTAAVEHSLIFLVKQIATTLPVCAIIFQILYHRKDRWFSAEQTRCTSCNQLLENRWRYCAFCGDRRPNRKKNTNAKPESS